MPYLRIRTFCIALLSTATAYTYAPPNNVLRESTLEIHYEADSFTKDDYLFHLLVETADGFRILQQTSPAETLATNADALKIASDVMRDSLKPFLHESVIVEKQISTRARKAAGDTFGYSVVTFPAIEIWTKATMRRMFDTSTNPPWFQFNSADGTVDQRFSKDDGTLYPLTLVVDLSEDVSTRNQRAEAFLRFWLQTMRAAHERLSTVYVFRAIQEVALADLQEARVPEWFKVGLSLRVAFTATSRLLGDNAAKQGLEETVGPSAAPGVRSLQISDRGHGALSKAESRIAYDRIVAAQTASSSAFVRVVLTRLAKGDAELSESELGQLYRSVASTNLDLLAR